MSTSRSLYRLSTSQAKHKSLGVMHHVDRELFVAVNPRLSRSGPSIDYCTQSHSVDALVSSTNPHAGKLPELVSPACIV